MLQSKLTTWCLQQYSIIIHHLHFISFLSSNSHTHTKSRQIFLISLVHWKTKPRPWPWRSKSFTKLKTVHQFHVHYSKSFTVHNSSTRKKPQRYLPLYILVFSSFYKVPLEDYFLLEDRLYSKHNCFETKNVQFMSNFWLVVVLHGCFFFFDLYILYFPSVQAMISSPLEQKQW